METFLQVCETLNYTKAAEKLNLTQPAVTQHIQYLEKEYNVELFWHRGKRLGLTAAGEYLRNAALTQKHDEIQLRNRMQQAQNQKTYIFGATRTAAEFMLPEYLEKFILRHPEDGIRMMVGNTAELLRKLDAGEIDFAIIEGEFPGGEYDSILFSRERFVAAADPKTAAKYKGAPMRALLAETMMAREQGSGSRDIQENELKRKGLEIRQFTRVVELANIGLIKRMVAKGLGITFLYEAAFKEEERKGEIEPIELSDFRLEHDVMFLFRKNSLFKTEYEEIYKDLHGK